ncbi:hypothetical protein [Dyadobacter sp. CY312]|uniref:hypothetical protein n=1 Tax=Dyadobacter sp. CY312 TaxID=2907303 RepID=UPI001F456EA0|nr:hypothetical protein [Dyadobacter sp. CY312]MCE7039215.1 hypothetical protein [Dyadobacter sp. CY312]
MRTFLQHLQAKYGTEDDMDYILPRLTELEIKSCVKAYTREAIIKHLNRAAENATFDLDRSIGPYPVPTINKDSIIKTEIILS